MNQSLMIDSAASMTERGFGRTLKQITTDAIMEYFAITVGNFEVTMGHNDSIKELHGLIMRTFEIIIRAM